MTTRAAVRRNRSLMVSVAVVVAAVVAVNYDDSSDQQQIDIVASETKTALCALRLDIETRSKSTQEFIDGIRTGRREPIPGISIADLQRSVNSQQSTLEALKPLDCPKEEP
jgi:hypothetical protein